MGQVQSLKSFEPVWLVDVPEHRWAVGLEIRCPTHQTHRIRMLFVNPADGGAGLSGYGPTFYRVGESFAELTILAEEGDGEHPLEVPGHWAGRIISGQLYTDELGAQDVTRRIAAP